MVLGVFSDAKRLLKTQRFNIDNWAFRLFYRPTLGILFASLALLGCNHLFGKSIQCSAGGLEESYCWIQGLWTIREKENLYNPGTYVQAHPGVGAFNPDIHEKVIHRFYQWVPIVLVISAAIFYIPRHLWKMWDGGRMSLICSNMKEEAQNDAENEKRVTHLMNYFDRPLYNRNRRYVIQHLVCEGLNSIAVLSVWVLTDSFLGGRFNAYGRHFNTYLKHGMVTDGPEDLPAWDVNPMDSVFPKVAKCDFHRIGASGTEEKVDVMCVLPLNVVNEKIFYVLWFWYILLALASLLNLAYRIITYFSEKARVQRLFKNCAHKDFRRFGVVVSHWKGYGDYHMLHRIKSNTDVDTFSMFIIALCDKVLAENAKEEQRKKEGQTQPPPIYTTHHDKLGHLTEKGYNNVQGRNGGFGRGGNNRRPPHKDHSSALGRAANLTVKNCAKLAMKGQEIGREIIRSAANSPMGSRRASPVNQRKRFHVNHQEMNSTPRENSPKLNRKNDEEKTRSRPVSTNLETAIDMPPALPDVPKEKIGAAEYGSESGCGSSADTTLTPVGTESPTTDYETLKDKET